MSVVIRALAAFILDNLRENDYQVSTNQQKIYISENEKKCLQSVIVIYKLKNCNV